MIFHRHDVDLCQIVKKIKKNAQNFKVPQIVQHNGLMTMNSNLLQFEKCQDDWKQSCA